MPHPSAQLDEADDKFDRGLEQLASARAAMILKEAARLLDMNKIVWTEKTVRAFLEHDKLDLQLPSNQGVFNILVRRG